MKEKETDDFWPILEISTPPTVKNSDNGWLDTTEEMVGVSMVNGPCAEEVLDFKPTRHELYFLAKYWAERAIEIEFSWFNKKKSLGDSAIRRRFARERLKRIRTILGTDVDIAINDALQNYGAKQDFQAWDVFLCEKAKAGTRIFRF